MARVTEEQLKKFENIEKHEHFLNVEKRNRRILALLDKCHKINLLHKIKESLFGKCKVCKELEGLR